MINTANMFINAYTEKSSSLKSFVYNGEFPEAAAILEQFQDEFGSYFKEALKVREEWVLAERARIQKEREESPESHSEFYDMLMSNIISTIPQSVKEADVNELPF